MLSAIAAMTSSHALQHSQCLSGSVDGFRAISSAAEPPHLRIALRSLLPCTRVARVAGAFQPAMTSHKLISLTARLAVKPNLYWGCKSCWDRALCC